MSTTKPLTATTDLVATTNSVVPTPDMYAGSKKPDIKKIIVEDFYDLDGLPFELPEEQFKELDVY
jgi:hypothetical protein